MKASWKGKRAQNQIVRKIPDEKIYMETNIALYSIDASHGLDSN